MDPATAARISAATGKTAIGVTAATGTAIAGAVGAGAVIGVGIGIGINKGYEYFTGSSIGSDIYDTVHPEVRPLTLADEIGFKANKNEVKDICNAPPPTNLNQCELARWNLTKALQCKTARGRLSNKYFGGPDEAHKNHILNTVDPQIKRMRDAVDRLCAPGCQ